MQTESVQKVLICGIWAGILLLLFTPLVVSTQTIFPFIVGKAVYARIIIDLVFGLWLLLVLLNPAYRPPRSRLLYLFLAYLVASLLAGFFGVSFQRSLWSTYERMQGVVDLAHWIALMFVLASVVKSTHGLRIIFNVNLGISLVLSLMGLALGAGVTGIPFFEYLQASERLGLTLGNAAFVGAYMMINVLIGAGLLLHSLLQRVDVAEEINLSQARRSRRRRRGRDTKVGGIDTKLYLLQSFWIIAVLLDLWVMTLTGTRGAIIGLGAGLAVFAIGYSLCGQEKLLKYASAGFLGLFVLLVILIIMLRGTPLIENLSQSNVLVRRIAEVSIEEAPFQSRITSLRVGFKAFTSKPVLGWGPENYLVPFGRYYTKGSESFETLDQAHNKPLEELVTKGIVGFVAFLAVWAFALRVLFRRYPALTASEQAFVLMMGAALTAYFVQNLFLFDTAVTMLQFVLLMGFVAVLESQMAKSQTGDDEPASRSWAMGTLAGLPEKINVTVILNHSIYRSVTGFKVLGLAVIATGFVLLFVSMIANVRVYDGATTIRLVGERVSSMEGVVILLKDSIKSFEPLANYPRLIFFGNVSKVWNSLNEDEEDLVLAFVETEGERATKAEPENWRIYMEMAKMYQIIANMERDEELVAHAKRYADEATRLAPELREIALLNWRIGRLEEIMSQRELSGESTP